MGEAPEEFLSGVEATTLQGPGDRSFVPSGKAPESFGVGFEHLLIDTAVTLGPPARPGGDQLAEIAIALARADQEGEAWMCRRILTAPQTEAASLRAGRFKSNFRPHQRPNPRLLGRFVEPWRSEDAVAVHQGDRRQVELGRPGHQVLGLGGSVEEGEGRGGVQFGIGNRDAA